VKVIGNLTKDAIIRAAVSEGLDVTQALGTPVTFHADITYANKVVYDSNAEKIVIIYTDGGNSNYPTAVVGTVNASNNSISFGSATVIETTSIDTNRIGVGFDSSNNKIVVAYRDTSNSDKGRAAVGTVSGTSISFGTPVDFQASLVSQLTATFDSNENRFVIGYRDSSNSNYGTAIVGTVSGTSISFGTKVVFNSGNTTNLDACVFDSSNNKVIFAYRDQGASQQITAVVGTVSGTSISFGSEVVVSSNSGTYPALAFDSVNNKVALAWNDQPATNVAKCAIGTVSGTSISFGTAVEFDEISAYFSGAFDANAGKVVFVYQDIGNGSKPTIASGTISGTSITFDTPVAIENTQMNVISGCAYDSGNKKIVASYMDDGNSDHGDAVVFQASYSSATGGTIADGKAVIVNANGTVSTVSQSTRDQSVSSAVTFESASVNYISTGFDSTSNKVIVAYQDTGNSQYGTAVVGTVVSGEITFGTPVVFESATVEYPGVAYDSSNDKVVISYTDVGNSNRGTAIVGTVSGTSISFGSAVVFDTQTSRDTQAIFDNVNNKIVIVYRNSDNNNRNHAIVGTVSGTSISFGSDVQYSETNNYNVRAAYIGNSKFVTVQVGSSDVGKAYVGTVSGTSVSFGSVANVNSTNRAQDMGISYDSTADKVVVAFKDSSDNSAGVVVGTVSGTSISFGSSTSLGSVTSPGDNSQISCVYDSANDKTIIGFPDNSNSQKGTIKAGTVSGTSITLGDAIVFEEGATRYISGVFDSVAERVVFAYEDDDDSDYGKAIVYQSSGTPSNLTSENFVGFMKGAALDGTNGEILSSCSIARNQTGLTAGQTYFVSPTDGALSETAGSPSVTAGTAISSTEIIVKG
jgi:hypothetical protein